MNLGSLGTFAAVVLPPLAVIFGLLFKRSQDRADAKAKVESEREAARAVEDAQAAANARTLYEQMRESQEADRTALRAVQGDFARLRAESEDLWSKMGAMRRTLNAYEAHIDAWNRWADAGCKGDRPAPIVGLTT